MLKFFKLLYQFIKRLFDKKSKLVSNIPMKIEQQSFKSKSVTFKNNRKKTNGRKVQIIILKNSSKKIIHS